MVAYPLRSYLAKHSLTYVAFAARVGVHNTTVLRWVRGDRRPSIDQVLRIERATGGEVPASAWSRPARARRVVSE